LRTKRSRYLYSQAFSLKDIHTSMDNPYRLYGTETSPLLDRTDLLCEVLSHLEKATPDHVSIVGEKYSGKTVLLTHLKTHFQNSDSHFDSCCYISLKHEDIDGDESFYAALAREFASAVREIDPEMAEYLKVGGEDIWEMIGNVFKTLGEQRNRILVLFDDFDIVPSIDNLSKNVWDNLRSLAEMSSLRFVTASRRRLRELHSIHPEDWWTSDFHRIFSPVRIDAAGQEDLDAFLGPLVDERGVSFEKGARTELHNQTGGIPILIVAVCKRLWEGPSGEIVDHQRIQQEVGEVYFNERMLLEEIWEELSEKEKEVIARLENQEKLSVGEHISAGLAHNLDRRGYLQKNNQKVEPGAKLMVRFAAEYGAAATAIGRHFSVADDYESNVPKVLERRFDQISHIDNQLRDFTETALQKADTPHVLLEQIRAIARRGIQIVLGAESSSGEIPEEWVREWRKGNSGVQDPIEGAVPENYPGKLKVIRDAVDGRNSVNPSVSRDTSELIHFLYSTGNYGQHQEDDDPAYPGFALSACMAAVELCSQLSEEYGEV
jgi:Cdc6-like AAA superfamily ATPase